MGLAVGLPTRNQHGLDVIVGGANPDDPVTVWPGDTIRMECTWNNSRSNPDLIHDPPQETRYGERTDEEMCFAFAFMSLAP